MYNNNNNKQVSLAGHTYLTRLFGLNGQIVEHFQDLIIKYLLRKSNTCLFFLTTSLITNVL